MRILMLGWEFPPFISGGLGTACYGLTKAMKRMKMEILFLLPTLIENKACHQMQSEFTTSEKFQRLHKRSNAGHIIIRSVRSQFSNPYPSTSMRLFGTGAVGGYEGNLIDKVWTYADRCVRLARNEQFDVIHAHDWMTFPAGIALAVQSGKPLISQVHATEFDRSGEYLNSTVYDIERQGMHASTMVIAVSHLTKKIIAERYGVATEKVRVVHNGIEPKNPVVIDSAREQKEKIVLFLGRITMQKGPEFFVNAAARVLAELKNVKFIIAGWGDLAPRVIEQVAAMGLGSKIHFTGFLRGKQVEHAYRMADVYVMPSVSEPFGLTALEAIQNGLPTILSKTSGVAEVLSKGVLKVDFWDVQEIAKKIVAVLKHPSLAEQLCRNGSDEIRTLTWDVTAQRCISVYQRAIDTYKIKPINIINN